jgi:hypothetical protein
MHRLLRVRGPVSVRLDSTNFGSHPPKQGAEEIVVKPSVWVDGDLCERLSRYYHECFSSSLFSDGRVVHNRCVYSSRKVVGHDQYHESFSARWMMDVSVIHRRTHSRMMNRRQGNSRTRNGSIRFHANHAMIMKEIRSILQVFWQGIDVQRLTEDVRKLREAGMVQGTVQLGQVSQ